MAGYSIDIFKTLYKDHVAKFNARMLTNYNKLKNEFKYAVDKAAVDFPATPFGASIISTTEQVVDKRRPYLNDVQFRSHVQNMFMHKIHGIIEIQSSEIQERTNKGYLTVCNKLFKIYQGTKWSFGHDELIRLDLSKVIDYYWYNNKDYPLTLYCPNLKRKSHRGPKQIIVTNGLYHNKAEFAWVVNNAWQLDVEVHKGLLGDDTVYVWPSKNPPLEAAKIATNLTKKKEFPDLKETLKAADEAVWPQTQTKMRQG